MHVAAVSEPNQTGCTAGRVHSCCSGLLSNNALETCVLPPACHMPDDQPLLLDFVSKKCRPSCCLLSSCCKKQKKKKKERGCDSYLFASRHRPGTERQSKRMKQKLFLVTKKWLHNAELSSLLACSGLRKALFPITTKLFTEIRSPDKDRGVEVVILSTVIIWGLETPQIARVEVKILVTVVASNPPTYLRCLTCVNCHRDGMGRGRNPRNCCRLEILGSSWSLKGVSSHTDRGGRGHDPRSCRRC